MKEEYYYILNGDVVVTDYELTPDKYLLGTTIDDYANGAYVLLSESLIKYHKDHPEAFPEDIFFEKLLSTSINVRTRSEQAMIYKGSEIEYVTVNGERLLVLNWRILLDKVLMYEQLGREDAILEFGSRFFRTTVEKAKKLLNEIGLFEFEVNIISRRHARYLEKNPLDLEYDYTLGYPKELVYELEEVEASPILSDSEKILEDNAFQIIQETSEFLNTKKFIINGDLMWINSELRQSLKSIAETFLKESKSIVTLWNGVKSYKIPCDYLIDMLNKIEEYSYTCFNIFSAKKASIKNSSIKADSIESLDSLESTYQENSSLNSELNYPEILIFTIEQINA